MVYSKTCIDSIGGVCSLWKKEEVNRGRLGIAVSALATDFLISMGISVKSVIYLWNQFWITIGNEIDNRINSEEKGTFLKLNVERLLSILGVTVMIMLSLIWWGSREDDIIKEEKLLEEMSEELSEKGINDQ